METTDPQILEAIKEALRQNTRQAGHDHVQIREALEQEAIRRPPLPGLQFQEAVIGHMRGEWVSCGEPAPALAGKAVLYLHGGGFTAGSCAFYRELAGRLAEAAGIRVLVPEYRLAPEHPYPAANEDALAAYRWLLGAGYSPGDIVLGGDSVGASLVLMTLLALRDAGEEMPAGAFLVSPHADLVHLDGGSYVTRRECDPTGSLETSKRILLDYLQDWYGEIPEILSPLRMDLAGLPPLLIQAGGQEVLLDDAIRLAAKAEAAGVEVQLDVYEPMWSVFHLFAYLIPEAREAISAIGRHAATCLSASSARPVGSE